MFDKKGSILFIKNVQSYILFEKILSTKICSTKISSIKICWTHQLISLIFSIMKVQWQLIISNYQVIWNVFLSFVSSLITLIIRMIVFIGIQATLVIRGTFHLRICQKCQFSSQNGFLCANSVFEVQFNVTYRITRESCTLKHPLYPILEIKLHLHKSIPKLELI